MTDPPLIHPFAGLLILLGLTTLITIATWVWSSLGRRWRHGEPLVPREPRREVPWRLIHVVSYLLLNLVFISLFAALAEPARDPLEIATAPQPTMRGMIASSLAALAGVAVGIPLIQWTAGATRKDWGLPGSWSEAGRDFRLGAALSTAVVIPIFLVQWLLTWLVIQWSESPDVHPILRALDAGANAMSFLTFLLIAVVAAPLTEELFFRVLLQGWFERLAQGAARETRPVVAPLESLDSTQIMTIPIDRPTELVVRPAFAPRWPIVASAAIFAAAHAGHGPDPIPIFLLALALGYLYHQTHRLLPSLALHACFNGYSVVLVAIQLLFFDGKLVP